MTTRLAMTNIGRVTTRLSPWLPAVMVAFLVGQSARAQAPAVLFQHGINSDGSTWEPMSIRLAQVFDMTPHTITTGSRREYERQAEVLRDLTTNLSSSTIGVGHSNGGIVLRDANRMGRSLRGIVTIGTAHNGAGIATSLMNGDFGGWITYLTSATAAPVLVYRQFNDGSKVWQDGRTVANAWNSFGIFMGGFADAYGLVYEPLLTEMAPQSLYRDAPNGLNSFSNKSREAAAVPNRVGIVSNLGSTNGVVFRAIGSQTFADYNVLARDAGVDVLTAAYLYYSFYDNYEDPYRDAKVDNADLWWGAAHALQQMDISWCYIIGAWMGPSVHYAVCIPSDGIVSTESQIYPIETRRIEIQGVSHNEETSSDVTYNTLRGIFGSGSLAIPHKSPPPPPPTPLSASIEGPLSIPSGSTNSWTANVSGGQPPYTYEWHSSFPGLYTATTPSITATYVQQSSGIYLRVVDAANNSVTQNIYVNVCAFYPC